MYITTANLKLEAWLSSYSDGRWHKKVTSNSCGYSHRLIQTIPFNSSFEVILSLVRSFAEADVEATRGLAGVLLDSFSRKPPRRGGLTFCNLWGWQWWLVYASFLWSIFQENTWLKFQALVVIPAFSPFRPSQTGLRPGPRPPAQAPRPGLSERPAPRQCGADALAVGLGGGGQHTGVAPGDETGVSHTFGKPPRNSCFSFNFFLGRTWWEWRDTAKHWIFLGFRIWRPEGW